MEESNNYHMKLHDTMEQKQWWNIYDEAPRESGGEIGVECLPQSFKTGWSRK